MFLGHSIKQFILLHNSIIFSFIFSSSKTPSSQGEAVNPKILTFSFSFLSLVSKIKWDNTLL